MKENKSPWLHNFKYERKISQMTGTISTDICIVGGGIAGVATAYMILKNTDKKVVLIEGDLVAHGATGHNAGYVIAEFEKPFKDIVKDYGINMSREGQKEIESAWEDYIYLNEILNLPKVEKLKGYEAFSDVNHFIEYLHEEYLKYGEIRSGLFLRENSDWFEKIPENFKGKIMEVNDEEFVNFMDSKSNIEIYKAVISNNIAVSNSAVFTETLVKYCLENFTDRFTVYEKTFITSVRLLQNGNAILDSLYGVCHSEKVILCTNGFENFNIYGPYGMKVDKDFHHSVSGLIGYMIGTFQNIQDVKIRGNIFYGEDFKYDNGPYDSGPYIYCTNRKFRFNDSLGSLFSVGGPEVKLHDRKIYKKDHLVDSQIYEKLEKFQKDIYGINEEPVFRWHGLMGYTKTGIRMVGKDRRFLNLFYNLGCNGIGILPSIAGALRISKLISGEKLDKSIFDPS